MAGGVDSRTAEAECPWLTQNPSPACRARPAPRREGLLCFEQMACVLASPCRHEHMFMSDEPPPIEACPAPDRVLHLPLGNAVDAATSTTLMKSAGLELIRLVIPAGKEIPAHRAPGEITVQCIEGHVAFEHDGHAVDLHAGDLLHLCPQESHALKGISDSSVLVTRLRPHADELPEKFPTT